MAASMKLP